MNPATCSDNLQRHILEGLVKVGRYFFMLWLSLWHVAKQQPFGTFRIPALIPNIMLLSHRFQSENSRCPHSGHFTSLLPWYATGGLNITFYNMYIIYIYTFTYIHTYVHTYRQTDIHTYIHTYIYTFTYLHTYILTYLHTYIHTYIHTHRHTYIHTHIYIHLQTYTHAYIHTYRHTYIHTHIYIHIYIYICAHYVIGWSI